MEFFEALNEGVINVTNPREGGLVTLVTWNYFDLNEDVTNVTNRLEGGLVTLVTWNFLKL
jgi:hypothetical protein